MRINLAKLDFTRATEKARTIKPLVRRCDTRLYFVKGSRGWHRVEFFEEFDGRFAACDCEHARKLADGTSRIPRNQKHPSSCYHIAAACAIHLGLMALAKAGENIPPFHRNPIEAEAERARAKRSEARQRFLAARNPFRELNEMAERARAMDEAVLMTPRQPRGERSGAIEI